MWAPELMDQTLSKPSDGVGGGGLAEVWGPGKANPFLDVMFNSMSTWRVFWMRSVFK